MRVVGLDVGSTTVKAVVVEDGAVRWQDYKRHNTKQAEMVLEFLGRMQAECGLEPGRDIQPADIARRGFAQSSSSPRVGVSPSLSSLRKERKSSAAPKFL